MIPNARSNRGIIRIRGPFKVLITLVTLWSFLFNMVSYDLAWAARTPLEPTGVGSNRAGGPDSPGIFKELHPDTFTLPEYLGRINGLNKANSDKIIIHIQDAHCNYYAQKKIAEIIEYLNKQYGVDTVNLEGGAKDYDLSIFTNIADKAIRNKVSDYFVKEGLVNGAEYFAINNPEKATLWGIEDTKLYIDNLKIYRDSLKYKNEVDRHLKALTHILDNLKVKIYSQELLELDGKYSQYKIGNLTFKDYLAYLIQIAKQRAVDIKTFNNIYLLSQTLEEEGKIDFKKANTQRDILIDILQKKSSKKSLEEIVLKTIEFKTEKISQKDFYAYLARKAKLLNIDLKDSPELQKYIVYISMYDAIDKTKTMDEMDKLENAIKETLYQNDKQKKLDKLSKNLAILKNIFSITLTKDDYKYYIDNKPSFNTSSYASFINKEAPLYKIMAQLDSNITGLDHYRDDISEFYEYSLKRDEAFLKNIRFNKNRKISIMVTGGFHTENLCEIFKTKGISYISIMPNFKNDNGYESPYFKLLSGGTIEEDKKIRSILDFSTMAIASILNQLGEKAFGKEEYIISMLKLHMAIAKAKGSQGIEVINGTDKKYYGLNWEPIQPAENRFEPVSLPSLAGLELPSPTQIESTGTSPVTAPVVIDKAPGVRERIANILVETARDLQDIQRRFRLSQVLRRHAMGGKYSREELEMAQWETKESPKVLTREITDNLNKIAEGLSELLMLLANQKSSQADMPEELSEALTMFLASLNKLRAAYEVAIGVIKDKYNKKDLYVISYSDREVKDLRQLNDVIEKTLLTFATFPDEEFDLLFGEFNADKTLAISALSQVRRGMAALKNILAPVLNTASAPIPTAAGAVLGHFQALRERGVNVAEDVAKKAGISVEELADIVFNAQKQAGLIDLEGQHTRKVISALKERLPGIIDEEAGILAVAGEGGLAPLGGISDEKLAGEIARLYSSSELQTVLAMIANANAGNAFMISGSFIASLRAININVFSDRGMQILRMAANIAAQKQQDTDKEKVDTEKTEQRTSKLSEAPFAEEAYTDSSINTGTFLDMAVSSVKTRSAGRIIDKLVAHGDIHGALDGFKENLQAAGLIDKNGNWIGGKAVLVQMGDVIDRGPKSREAFKFLKKLQEQARAVGGDVIRLLGNHELMLIQGDTRYLTQTLMQQEGMSETEAIAESNNLIQETRKDILTGDIVGAYFANGRMFVHGGLRSKIRENIGNELVKQGLNRDSITEEDIKNRINEVLREAVQKDKFSHCIFDVDFQRGGMAEIAGIFWADFSGLAQSIRAADVKQVVGHTPERRPGAGIRGTGSVRRIDIDAGLYEGYGGNQAFLVIEVKDGMGIVKAVEKIHGEYKERILERNNLGQAPAVPQTGIPKPGVGTTEGYVNEAILKAHGQLISGQINAQQAAEMIIQAIITMPDNLEGITNMPTAIGICQQALNETSDPRLTEVLAILRQYDASPEVDELLADKIRNIWEQTHVAPKFNFEIRIDSVSADDITIHIDLSLPDVLLGNTTISEVIRAKPETLEKDLENALGSIIDQIVMSRHMTGETNQTVSQHKI